MAGYQMRRAFAGRAGGCRTPTTATAGICLQVWLRDEHTSFHNSFCGPPFCPLTLTLGAHAAAAAVAAVAPLPRSKATAVALCLPACAGLFRSSISPVCTAGHRELTVAVDSANSGRGLLIDRTSGRRRRLLFLFPAVLPGHKLTV